MCRKILEILPIEAAPAGFRNGQTTARRFPPRNYYLLDGSGPHFGRQCLVVIQCEIQSRLGFLEICEQPAFQPRFLLR